MDQSLIDDMKCFIMFLFYFWFFYFIVYIYFLVYIVLPPMPIYSPLWHINFLISYCVAVKYNKQVSV